MDELALEARESMQKSIKSFRLSLNTLRTGRASAAVLDRIEVDYYGDKMPINQISGISIPEPRQLVIKPYDKGDLKSIASALYSSDLGINPLVEADVIRLIFPPLTEERRKDLARQAKKFAEDTKVAIRNIRREFIDLASADDYSEDLQKRIQADIQRVTEEATGEIEIILKEKEQEILSI